MITLMVNFLEAMGVLFTAILALLFGFVIVAFLRIRREMKKNVKQPKTENDDTRRMD